MLLCLCVQLYYVHVCIADYRGLQEATKVVSYVHMCVNSRRVSKNHSGSRGIASGSRLPRAETRFMHHLIISERKQTTPANYLTIVDLPFGNIVNNIVHPI